MSVNPISTNQFYGENETKRTGDVVHYLQDNRVYTHLNRETRKEWQVLFDHNRPVTSNIALPLALFVISGVILTGLVVTHGLLLNINTGISFLTPGSFGAISVGALIYDVGKYREGKRVADQAISRDRFEEMIRQIKESLEPQKALYDSIQLQAQED